MQKKPRGQNGSARPVVKVCLKFDICWNCEAGRPLKHRRAGRRRVPPSSFARVRLRPPLSSCTVALQRTLSARAHAKRGIVLAVSDPAPGYTLTIAVSKQLMPVYDKPMIYYPLSALMLADIRDILIISTPHDLPGFQKLLGDGSQFGLHFEYAEQPKPEGLAQAFLIGEKFLDGSPAALVLGDNLFYGTQFRMAVERAGAQPSGATILRLLHSDSEIYGVVEFDKDGKAISWRKSPRCPSRTMPFPGVYFYDERVVELPCSIKPSKRGELEITDLNAAST